VRQSLGVNTSDGTEWLDRDRLASLLSWALRLDALDTGAPSDSALAKRVLQAAEAAAYRVDALRAALSEPGPARTKRRKRATPQRPS
jgi:hypothetical protein